MGRKTIAVSVLVDEVNRLLKESTCMPDVRRGYQAVLETVLHSTGNYAGFRYLGHDEVPLGFAGGINRDGDGGLLPYPERFKNTDSSRVQYHKARGL